MANTIINARWDTYICDAIRTLITRNRGNVQDWVGLVDLRPILDGRGTSRTAQDEHLKRMSREGKISLAPESNRKALVAADHAAAVEVGGDDCHIVAIPN